jgi:F-type H+-transporting ATPase subunit delta
VPTQNNNSAYAYCYAKAIFSLARARKQIEEWDTLLDALVIIAKTPGMMSICNSPQIKLQQQLELFTNILASIQITIPTTALYLITLLLRQHIFALIPQIHTIYRSIRAENCCTVNVQVASAQSLTEVEQQEIISALALNKAYHNYTIKPNYTVDPSLLGGSVIRIRDKVIDISIRGQLQRLQKLLTE